MTENNQQIEGEATSFTNGLAHCSKTLLSAREEFDSRVGQTEHLVAIAATFPRCRPGRDAAEVDS